LISERLTEVDPSNAGWQRDLAAAHSLIGGVYQSQGRLGDALSAFQRSLVIREKFSDADPSNFG
jgi:hypothetical protein